MTVSAWDGEILVLAGCVTSAISGVLGQAGGIALLGTMTAVLPAESVIPLHGVVQVFSNFTRTFVLLKHVCWRIFSLYSIPMLAGVGVAALVYREFKLEWFRPELLLASPTGPESIGADGLALRIGDAGVVALVRQRGRGRALLGRDFVGLARRRGDEEHQEERRTSDHGTS